MKKKEKIKGKFDVAKAGREASREIFKGVRLGTRAFRDKKKYSRKSKHKLRNDKMD